MKKLFIWMIAGLCICTSLSAQRGGGRSGGNRGDFGGDRGNTATSRNQSQIITRDYDQVRITDFPEIAGLTYKQNLNLFKIVKDEQKNILKLTDQKQMLQNNINQAKNQKEIDKNTKSMAQLDEKVQKASLAADKKIKGVLTNDQYTEFISKKELIKFSVPPPQRGGGRPN